MLKKHFLHICLMLLPFVGMAQHESTLYFMHSLPQSTQYNPSRVMDYKLAITLPGMSGVYGLVANDGFSFNDAVDLKDGTATISLEKLGKRLADQNTIRFQTSFDWFGVYVRRDSLSINFHIGDRMEADIVYPRTLIDVLYKGTGHPDLLGKTIEISPKVNMLHYREVYLGFTHTAVHNKLHIGGAAKLLFGLGYVDATDPSITLNTANDGNYGLTLTASGQMRTAGLYSLFEGNNSGKDYFFNTKNKGIAIDFGFTYQLTDKLLLEGNALNLGFINWKDDLRDYQLNGTGSYTFEGVDAVKIFKSEGLGDVFESTLDTLEKVFQLESVSNGVEPAAYKSSLPSRLQVGARYQIAHNLFAGALFSTRFYKGDALPALSGAVVKEFGRIMTGSLSYTVTKRAPVNVGFGFALNLPIQIHVVSDNLLSALVSPASAKYVNFRVGANLVFGYAYKKKEAEAQEGGASPKPAKEPKQPKAKKDKQPKEDTPAN